ncbi:unnamed protein product [Heligmosomoides polygyrus]|uniref:Reverse transcriptase domain-containing protein n=1 Tax=Heligmosomoides polygyrus TaxID=6339 RepID=A0A183GVE0_HELPZ|nr:unnamed protein product [Heligmosomoides polygyrus]
MWKLARSYIAFYTRQGVLPLLFSVALDFIMRKSMKGDETGIKWSRTHHLRDLDFVDDVATITENSGLLQQATTNLVNEGKKIGLRLNPNKSKVMSIGRTDMNLAKISESRRELWQPSEIFATSGSPTTRPRRGFHHSGSARPHCGGSDMDEFSRCCRETL